jgi:hypothetical protein
MVRGEHRFSLTFSLSWLSCLVVIKGVPLSKFSGVRMTHSCALTTHECKKGKHAHTLSNPVVCCLALPHSWGLTKSQEMTIVRGIARQCAQTPLPDKSVGLPCMTTTSYNSMIQTTALPVAHLGKLFMVDEGRLP